MKKLLKYFQENKRNILIIVGVMALVIFIIHFMNYMISLQNKNQPITNHYGTAGVEDTTNPTETIIDGTNIPTEVATSNSEVIKKFVEYCNQKQYEEAYELLTDDCKEIMYQNDMQYFIDNYAKIIFATQKSYQLKGWLTSFYGYTYQISYYEGNPLQTGGVTSENNYMDYITIVTQGNEPKININKLIARERVDSVAENEFIKINVSNKTIFTDYETYEMTILNKTEKTILLNDGQQSNNIYLVDNDGIQFNSLINEIAMNLLTIQANRQRTLNIKFNRNYQGISNIVEMQINNIILDYEEYLENSSNENLQTTSIKINM